MKFIFFLFYIHLLALFTHAQGIISQKYTVEDGLPNSLVFTTFRDARNLIWCGTETGLALFQGNKFLPLVYSQQDTNCISSGHIYSICDDSAGNLWVATYSNGIVVFNPFLNGYRKISAKEHPELINNKHINVIKRFSEAEMLILTSKGAYLINIKTLKTRVLLPPEIMNDEVLSYQKIGSKEYFLIYKKGLFERSGKGDWHSFTLPNSSMNFIGMSTFNNQLFIHSFGGTYVFSDGRFAKCKIVYKTKDVSAESINEISSCGNQLFINSFNLGTLQATYRKGVFTCQDLINDKWFKDGNVLYSSYLSKEDSTHFVGSRQGLFVIKKSPGLFKQTDSIDNIGTIRSLYVKSGEYLIGTENGIFKGTNNKKPRKLKTSSNFFQSLLSIGVDSVLAMGQSAELIQGNNVVSEAKINKLISPEENAIVAAKIHEELYFFMNAKRRIYCWNLQTGTVDEYPMELVDDLIAPAISFHSKILILSYTGLFEFNAITKKTSRIDIQDDAMISDIQFYKDRIYFSSSTEGITILDTNYKRIQKIDLSAIVGNNEVRSIQVKDSIIWFATSKGLGYYNMNQSKIAFFKSGDNFNVANFYNSSKAVDEDTLYFGGEHGIVSINTKAVLAEKIKDKVYLINFSQYREGDIYKVVNPVKHIFRFDENNLELQLVHTNTEYPSFFQYQYQLNNTGRFIPIDESGLIKLYNLPPDNYHLEVVEKQSLELMATYDFTVAPPWYQTWWFRTLLGITILANGIWISRLYFKRKLIAQQKELEKQQALQSERDRISTDMHDDLGSGLSSIKLISEMLKKKHSDEETKNELNEIVDHATELTTTMREMVWSLNPRNDVLARFIDHTVHYARQFFEPSEVNFKVHASQQFPEQTMNGFVRRNLFLCFKEIFNNIIKHAEAKNASLSISYEANKLMIIILDDGKGIAEDHREGNGLYSIQKRIRQCGGTIQWVNQDPGLKTEIEIML